MWRCDKILKTTIGNIDYYSVITTITPRMGHYVIKKILFSNDTEAEDYMLCKILYYVKNKNIPSMEELKKEGFEYNWSY
jgi:hypothetical protein